MACTRPAAPATVRRYVVSVVGAADVPAMLDANRKNCRHDSSTEDGSRKYDSYNSATYASLYTPVMGREVMQRNLLSDEWRENSESVDQWVSESGTARTVS